jgi:hypothetical protein
MSKTSAFEFAVNESEMGAYLGGLLIAVIQGEITARQHDIARAMGRDPSDEEWDKMKEDVYRKALQTVARYFPEPLQTRIAGIETDMIASVLKLN